MVTLFGLLLRYSALDIAFRAPALLTVFVFFVPNAWGLLNAYLALSVAPTSGTADADEYKRHEKLALKWLSSIVFTLIGLTFISGIASFFGLPLAIPTEALNTAKP